MQTFLPDIYQKSVYSINYEMLKSAGIKIILFDLDNTIIPLHAKSATKKIKDLFDDIKSMGIKPVIISNARKKRVAPFKDELVVDASFLSLKPLKWKYKKILKIYNVKPSEIAAVGDQLITDIWGANRMQITSILVNPMSSEDLTATKINRFFEKIIIRHYTKKKVFKKGEYYE